ncbi:hypothetical protein Neosp_006991 [[Neocosmospora] mangrovei]
MDELMEFRAHGNELAQEDRLDLDEEVIYGVLANVYWVTAMGKMGRFFANHQWAKISWTVRSQIWVD